MLVAAGCGGETGEADPGRHAYAVTFKDVDMAVEVPFSKPEPDADYVVESIRLVETQGSPPIGIRCAVQQDPAFLNVVLSDLSGHGNSVTFEIVVSGLRNGG
jgi:hypothetical protein